MKTKRFMLYNAGIKSESAGLKPLVDTGVDWFKGKGQWLDGNEEPQEGMIIFFDWAYDGQGNDPDHTGVVEKVEDGLVYTIEGNSGDACVERTYPIGYFEILGYGAPEY